MPVTGFGGCGPSDSFVLPWGPELSSCWDEAWTPACSRLPMPNPPSLLTSSLSTAQGWGILSWKREDWGGEQAGL